MIKYDPFWITLDNSIENTYTLTKYHKISTSTLDKLRHNKPLTTTTLNDLCRILHCNIEDIVVYEPSDSDQIL